MSVWITECGPGGEGVRLAVKDLFDTAGIRTTYGSILFADHVPEASAWAVLALEQAGYAIAGKANLHEFAWGITSENEHFGWVPNPAAPGRTPGGSSGGNAAALVLGEADAALGTDSGGSIRIPAACCGISGFKPTHGLVSLEGCWPLAPSFDHAGPMARDVAGCEAMMAALAPGFAAAPEPALRDLRVAVAWTAEAEPGVRARVLDAAARFGAAEPVDLPLPAESYPLFSFEAAAVHREQFARHEAAYGENVAAKLRSALEVTEEQAAVAASARERYREQVAELTEGFDLLLTPTLETVAPASGIGDLLLRGRMIKLTYPFNATGAPALALPAGPAEDGLPASVQLVGRRGEDALVLAAGRALERALSPR
ncbi:MAG: amidase [Solirubrobacterales bacterium]|nr:amidase [Solirubrobacterales bacterium]